MSLPSFEFYDGRLLELVKQGDPHVHQFFRLLALCHTVMPEEKNGSECSQLFSHAQSSILRTTSQSLFLLSFGSLVRLLRRWDWTTDANIDLSDNLSVASWS